MLRSEDIVKMTDQMAADLAAAPAVARRGPDSPRWVVTLDQVHNRTEHPMEENERWATMARFRALLSQSRLRAERHIVFVLPANEWVRYAPGGDGPTAAPADQRRLDPTHALRATFLSDTTSSLAGRSDHYLCAFQLVDLRDNALIWEGAYEVRYIISRNRLD